MHYYNDEEKMIGKRLLFVNKESVGVLAETCNSSKGGLIQLQSCPVAHKSRHNFQRCIIFTRVTYAQITDLPERRLCTFLVVKNNNNN